MKNNNYQELTFLLVSLDRDMNKNFSHATTAEMLEQSNKKLDKFNTMPINKLKCEELFSFSQILFTFDGLHFECAFDRSKDHYNNKHK